jgi:iron complex transport system permease protein
MKREISLYVGGIFLLAGLFLLSLRIGVLHLQTPLLDILLKNNHGVDATTVWDIRLPRALGAIIFGAGLGFAGVIAQGIFRNPLAEPTLIGLSSGAVLGTIAVISSGAAVYGSRVNVYAAVGGAAITALLVQALAPNKGFGFLLTGIALSSILTSVAGLLITSSPKPSIQSLSFWNFGSLSLLNSQTLRAAAPILEIGIIASFFVARKLDIYSLGDSSSHYLGLNPKRLRLWAILALAFLIGASVSAIGSVAFIGLLIPHIVRALIGPSHRRLLSISGLVGAIVLLAADLVARTAFQPHEIPLGLITSLIGAPALIILLRRSRAQWVAHD